MKKLNVSEIFYSLQGEGFLMGFPAIFLRLAGCIAPFCDFCDTPHALTTENSLQLSIDETLKEIEEIATKNKCDTIIITGGEPFLQWKNLKKLDKILREKNFLLQYETSGKSKIPSVAENRLVICSPKNLKNFSQSDAKKVTTFKFLFEENEEEILNFIATHKIKKTKIGLMPKGKTLKEQLINMPQTWEICMKNGWLFFPRLHILAFDEKKGI